MRIQRRQFLHLGAVSLLAACDSSETRAPTDPQPDAPWWLSGNYAPVDESDAFDLEVVGTLPAALSGLYLRNGPNPFFGESEHWFLGDGMVHGVRLDGGKAAWYRGRYVQTDVLGVEPTDSLAPPGLTNHPANTAVAYHDGRLLTLLETGLPYELSRDDLSTEGPYDFAGELAGAMTAHPKVDPVTGELLFFGYNVIGPYLTYHAVDPQGQLTRSAIIDVPGPAMMHDFQITATHVVFMFLPVMFDIELALGGDSFPFRWDPSVGARIGVMPRDGDNDDVEWFDIEPCYVFHTFNAHDDGPGKVVLDAVRYPQMWVKSSEGFDSVGTPWRWEMTLGEGVTEQPWDDRGVEFPQIDPRRVGQSYRYGYAVTGNTEIDLGGAPDSIVKYDQQLGSSSVHPMEDGLQIGEAVFVPASDDADEDEGYLMTYGYDASSNTSDLLLLDARGMDTIARVKIPTRVPFGFHGIWAPDA